MKREHMGYKTQYGTIIRFEFTPTIAPEALEDDMLLALFCAECLYGTQRLQLEVGYTISTDGSSAVMEINGDCGHAVARIFLGLAGKRAEVSTGRVIGR